MTSVDIANQALNYLGEARIQSLTQATNSAKYANDALKPSVEQVLRTHKWNSALRRVTLVQLDVETEFGPAHTFQLPVDFLKVVKINDGVDDYRMEGDKLLSDCGTIELVYVAYPTDFGTLDPGLVEAIASKLAFNISINVTGDSGAQGRMLELHERLLARARTNDARESSREDQSLYAETLRDSPMIRARRTGSRQSPTRNRYVG